MSAEMSTAPTVERKQKYTAKVIKITLAGAIVDIGLEQPSIIHISQLSSEPIKRVEDAVKVGDELEVWVRRVDERNNRIELTTIEPLAMEWRDLQEGQKVSGSVTRIENYGVFIEIGAERPGMAHVSELAHDYVRNPSDILKVGDEVEAKVIGVNRRKKQIKLSLKALHEAPQEEEEEQQEEAKPAPTAMEIALRKAMDDDAAVGAVDAEIEAGLDAHRQDAEDILARTLENRRS